MANDVAGLFALIRSERLVDANGVPTTRFANFLSLLADSANNVTQIVEENTTIIEENAAQESRAIETNIRKIVNDVAQSIEDNDRNSALIHRLGLLIQENDQLNAEIGRQNAVINGLIKKVNDVEQLIDGN